MLDRAHITRASRVMLPTYAIMYTILGYLFLLQRPERTSGEAFDIAKMVLPIHGWGWVFAIVSALEVTAMWSRKRSMYMAALILGVGLAAFWTVVLGAAAVASPQVSFTGCVWVGGWVAAQMATALSLAAREH